MDAMTFLQEHVSLFAGVSNADLAGLAAASSMQTYNPGQTVLFKGGTVDGLYIVTTGQVTVQAKVANKGVVQLAKLGPTEVFGETSIVEMGTAGATIKASEAGATTLMIPQAAFRELLVRDESFAVRVNTLIRARKSASEQAPTPA